jgi:membrane protein required for beta-lactamase induction
VNLIALLLGLALERFLTRVLHLRGLRWLDGWFDRALALAARRGRPASLLIVLMAVLVPLAPVAWLQAGPAGDWPVLVRVAFAVVVLLFSLGPRDLLAEVRDYLDAEAAGDEATARRIERALMESRSHATPAAHRLESVVLVQAHHRVFCVVFWFMVLGPAGAWATRVADLCRRRAAFRAAGGAGKAAGEPLALWELVSWLPARILALSYAVAGSFEDAVADWRAYYRDTTARFFSVSEDVVAVAGTGAIRSLCPPEDRVGRVRAALRLVLRTIAVWLTAIAVLTLSGQAA